MWNAQLFHVQIENEACKPVSTLSVLEPEVVGQVVDCGSGRFVSTREGFIPMDLEKQPVLLEKWLVYTTDTKGLNGLRFRNTMQYVKKDGETLSWGTYVYGRQVETNWVEVDNLFLPIRFKDGRQVLWRESEPVRPDPSALSSSTRSVQLCLLAPQGTYKVTGTFTQNWQQRLTLQPEDLPEVGSKKLYVYYIDVPFSDLNEAHHFKFQKAEMGRLQFWHEYLSWEVEGEGHNRVFMPNPDLRSGTRVFMSYGHLKATEEDVRDFMKVALCGESLQNLDIAIRRLEEVEQSIRLVGFTTQMNQGTPSYVHNSYAVRRAFEDALLATREPQPSRELILWMAVLEQKATGTIRTLRDPFKEELLSIMAAWPPELMTDLRYTDCLNDVIRAAVLSECPPSRLWLKAAIQMILQGRVSHQDVAELKHRAKRLFGGFFDAWEGIQLQGPEPSQVQSAFQLALQACDTSDQVWFGAGAFLGAQNAHLWGAMCVQVALEEALTLSGRGCLDWEDLAEKLQLILDKLGDASRERQLQEDLESIIKKHWLLRGSRRPNRIPGFARSISTVLVAKALTADPDTACGTEFEDNSELAWLRIAASVGYQAHAPASVQTTQRCFAYHDSQTSAARSSPIPGRSSQ